MNVTIRGGTFQTEEAEETFKQVGFGLGLE